MIRDLPIEIIDRRADARAVDDATVSGLVESIATVGLINPIRVRAAGNRWEVVAGVHRLEACRQLGLADIACVVVEDDDLHAELAMIDENLCRAELSPVDRARQTARRKAIYLELHPETAQHVAGAHASNAAQGNATENFSAASFAADTAAKTGVTDRVVRLHAERGEKVIDEVMDMIRGTKLDTGSYLDKIKRLPPNEQVVAATRDLAHMRSQDRAKRKPVSPPDAPKNDIEIINQQHKALLSAWERARPEARERFLTDIGAVIDTPVMDHRHGPEVAGRPFVGSA